MIQTSKHNFDCTVQVANDDEFKRYLQGILNEHHATAYPLMEVPESKKFIVRATDRNGSVVGGALIWAYWGWLDVSLLAVEKHSRGLGLGTQLMAIIEKKAKEEGCYRIRVETFGNELGFYRKMGYQEVGHLQDYPEGYSHYWLRKDIK